MSSAESVAAQVVRFGQYEVDLAVRELRRNGSVVRLQERPFEVLAILLEHPGDVVTREEFRQRLWSSDIFVDFDASLNTSVNKLRQALSDNAENPLFVATVGRRGYRFIAPASYAKTEASPVEAQLQAAEKLGQGKNAGSKPWAEVALGAAAILLAAVFLFAPLLPEAQPRVSSVVQISRDGLLDPWGRLASDGARVFYLNRVGGHWALTQVPASGGEAQPFPVPSPNTRVVGVSPDRSELLSFGFFGRSTDLLLSLTPVVGGSPRRVGNIIADDAVFSPDGRRIFYTRPDGIYSCARDGSQVEKLVALPDRSEFPQWSPDGKRLRFSLKDRRTDRMAIWEVSADGTNLHAVDLNLPAPASTYDGRWSSDGRYYFFTSAHDGVQSVWAIHDGVRHWLSRPSKPVQLTFGPVSYGGPVTDGNSNRVFVWGGDEQSEIARYSAASGRLELLLPNLRTSVLRLSPDGKWMSFAIGGDLWRSAADGSQRRPLVSGFPAITQIDLSPDGKRILFHTAESPGAEKFYLVSAEGGPATEISLGSGHIEPSWTPDSSSIAFARLAVDGTSPEAADGIFALDVESSRISKIPGSNGMVHPIFSPDQRFLAAVTNFDAAPNEPTRVKLFDRRTGAWTEIAHGTLVNPVQWSADSKSFYYQDILADGEAVYRYSMAGNKTEPFLDFASLLRSGYVRCSLLSFAPDGSLIVALRRNEVNVYRLDLDLP